MRKTFKVAAIAAMLAAGIVAAPALYAHESQGSQGSMQGSGMMGQGGMMGGGNMMGKMNQMMETCNKMMQAMMDGHGRQTPGGEPGKGSPEKEKKS